MKSQVEGYPPVQGIPVLVAHTEAEVSVLGAFGQDHRLTAHQLTSRTGLAGEELQVTLCELQAGGLIACLNTVIVSYCLRFPGAML